MPTVRISHESPSYTAISPLADAVGSDPEPTSSSAAIHESDELSYFNTCPSVGGVVRSTSERSSSSEAPPPRLLI